MIPVIETITIIGLLLLFISTIVEDGLLLGIAATLLLSVSGISILSEGVRGVTNTLTAMIGITLVCLSGYLIIITSINKIEDTQGG